MYVQPPREGQVRSVPAMYRFMAFYAKTECFGDATGIYSVSNVLFILVEYVVFTS